MAEDQGETREAEIVAVRGRTSPWEGRRGRVVCFGALCPRAAAGAVVLYAGAAVCEPWPPPVVRAGAWRAGAAKEGRPEKEKEGRAGGRGRGPCADACSTGEGRGGKEGRQGGGDGAEGKRERAK